VECDPSIKSIILKIDAEEHAYIVEELDEQTLVVKETMVNLLKQKLQEVSLKASETVAKLTRDISILRQRSKSRSFLVRSSTTWEWKPLWRVAMKPGVECIEDRHGMALGYELPIVFFPERSKSRRLPRAYSHI
jgi:TFIIH basal transcription factor complex TTD-A subunit